jgi:peptidoglycan/LPS O-acetylase OafA/YrhL
MSVHSLTVKPRARGLLWSFLIGFLVVGVPYWRIPYNKATSAAVMGGAILIGVVALIARVLTDARFLRVVLVVAAAVPAAVMARVVVDTTRDPTSHNLWPFELVIAFLVGLAGTVPGTLIGSVFRRMLGKG